MASASLSDLLGSVEGLKAQGNAEFKKQGWERAASLYSQALASFDQLPVSQQQQSQSLKAVILGNRAACNLKQKCYDKAIADCNSAEKADSKYEKAPFRRAQAYEALGLQKGVVSGGAKDLNVALRDFAKLCHINPKNKEAAAGAARVRRTLEKATEDQKSPSLYLDRLKANSDDPGRDIKHLMSLFVTGPMSCQPTILAADFARTLLDFFLGPIEKVELALVALRALVTLLLKTAANVRQAEGKPDVTACVNFSAADIKHFHNRVPQILNRLHDLRARALKGENYQALFQHTINFVGHFASHLSFARHRKIVLESLLAVLSASLGSSVSPVPVPSGSYSDLDLLASNASSAIKSIAVVASADKAGLEAARAIALPVLLFANAELPLVRHSAITALAVLTGNDPAKAAEEDQDKYDKLNKALSKDEKKKAADEKKEQEDKFKQGVMQTAVAPLLAEDLTHAPAAMKALTLLIQANPKLGVDAVKARWKLSREDGKPVTLPKSAAVLALEQAAKAKAAAGGAKAKSSQGESKESKDEKDEKDEKEVQEGGEVDERAGGEAGGEADPGAKTEEEEGVTALQQLVFLAADSEEATTSLAAHCLALASSDAAIRQVVVESGITQVFFSLLSSADSLARAHAAVALSKIAAVGEVEHTETERKQLLVAVTAVLQAVSEQATAKEQRSKARRERRGDREGGEDDAEDDTFAADRQQSLLENARHIIESLSYLSLHIQYKQLLASTHNGQYLRTVFALADSKDKAIRFGVCSIVYNCSTSEDDINAEYDKEIEALRKMAAKGLPNSDKREELVKKAGSARVVKVIRGLLVQAGCVSALHKAVQTYTSEHQHLLEKVKGNPDLANAAAAGGGVPKQAVSDVLLGMLAKTLLHLATEVPNRGKMVQEGGLRLALQVFQACSEQSERVQSDAACAIARVCITTNPHLIPQQGLVHSLVAPLLWLMNNSKHELLQFESIMALTNLASMGEHVQTRILACDGWQQLQNVLSENQEMVQRAAVECLANLCTAPQVLERVAATAAGAQDLMILLMFCNSEDVPTQSAACGALAMMSDVPEVAVKIAEAQLTSVINLDDLGEEEEELRAQMRAAGKQSVELKRVGLQVLLSLQLQEDLDEGVRTRVNYALNNIEQAAASTPQTEGRTRDKKAE